METTNIHTYQSPSPTFALAISPSPTPTLAVGTFLENLSNQISLLTFSPSPPSFSPSLSFPHPYPPTKLLFHPLHPHLLASSSDSLRLWNVSSSSTPPNVFTSNSTAPFTSFDWNPTDPRLIAAASIDTTCTVWDVERSVIETQLIAHDKEVYDVVWGDKGVFASVSADGSVRMFDLRDKEHSTIVYESDLPLLRLAWSGKYMAVTVMDGSQVVVLDIRAPAAPVAELQRHQGSVNAVAWAPRSAGHVCSVADDGQALIWDVRVGAGPEGIDPVLAYDAGAEINQVQWSAAHPDWITIAFADKVQLLKV